MAKTVAEIDGDSSGLVSELGKAKTALGGVEASGKSSLTSCVMWLTRLMWLPVLSSTRLVVLMPSRPWPVWVQRLLQQIPR